MSSRGVAIVGGGSIGVAWSIVFARAGHRVLVYDAERRRRAVIAAEIGMRLSLLSGAGALEGDPATIAARVTVSESLAQAVADVAHVQECVPEDLELKRETFGAIEAAAPADAVLASSSSAICASRSCGPLRTRERALVVHPANPPHLLPVVEVVPAPFTAAETVKRTLALLRAAGMSPVQVRAEVEGFVFNRLQGALLREAYCLVRDGVAEVEDIDRVVREGLGRRWAVTGPFETADLNTRGGIAAHARLLGPAYARMGAERGQHDPWSDALIAEVTAQRRARLPLQEWEGRVRWREGALAAVTQALRAFMAGNR